MNKTKRPLSLLLAVVMVLSVFGGISFNASAAGIMSESFNTTQGSINDSINYDGNDISIYAVDGGDSYGFLLYDEDFYANIKARNTQRPVTITGAECTSGQYDIQNLIPLKGTMTINGDTATISDVYSSTLRLEADHTNLKIKAVTVYYYYAVASVTLNETYAAMNIGDTKTLTATVAPDDAMYKNVTWTSADPDIATVSDTGVVTAVAPGRVNITATADNGTADTSDDKTATFSVRVLGEVETTLSYLVWDDASKKLVEKTGDEACANYELITADTTALEDGKWYTIDDDTTVSGRITVNGTAHLILRDDLILTVPKGVTTTGATLNIYGQRAGTGTLSASAEFTNAGIGGTRQSAGGTVVIHGGTVTATGGQVGAGIGGGAMGTGGEVAIYGGTVTATGGQQGAGIGGGPQSAGGTVVIHGGTVTATGGQQAAGIGGGVSGAGGTINISGGEVTATGTLGAGIGGGYRAAGGNITITGGTVKAYSKGTTSNFGTAIGAGAGYSEQGTLMLAENMIVKAETVALADKEWEDLQEVAREDYMNDHAQRRAYLVTPVVAVTGVTLDQEAVTLNIGDTAPLTATVEPADATDKAVAWTSDNTAAVTVDENGVVTAVAPGTANVTAATADGGFTASCAVTVNVPTYTVTWLNDDGSLIDTTTVAYGETPTHADATKTATAQYTYTFAGWDKEIVAVTGDATYTATFDATVNAYTVSFVNEDGTELQSGTVDYGKTPAYKGEKPAKAADHAYTYTFAGWSDGTTTYAPDALPKVIRDAIYTATFTKTEKTEPQDWMSVRIDDRIYIKYLLHSRANLESVTVEYLDQDGVETVQTQAYTVDQLNFGENGVFEILAVIAPAQIGDLVKVTILANGQQTVYEYSVAKYCEYLIDGAYEENVKTLAKATLEYGKAANDYFSGTADFYHQSTITSPYSADYKEEALRTAKNLTNTLSVTDNLCTKLASAAFMALTQPEFRFYFNENLTEAKAVELNDNNQITTNVKGVTARFYKNEQTGAILLEVKGIEAAKMDEDITVTVGDLGTITFRGNDFARMMAKSDDQSIAALGAALYLYGKAAKDCFKPE